MFASFIGCVVKVILVFLSSFVSHSPIEFKLLCIILPFGWAVFEPGRTWRPKKIQFFFADVLMCVLFSSVPVLLRSRLVLLGVCCASMRLALSFLYLRALMIVIIRCTTQLQQWDSLLPKLSEKNTLLFLCLFGPIPIQPLGLLPLAVMRCRYRF